MVKLSNLRLDLDAIESGRWVDGPEGSRLRIASFESKAYTRAVRVYARGHQAEIEEAREAGGEGEVLDLFIRAAARELLTGWEGFDDDEGQPLPYTPEKAFELVNDDEYAWLIDTIRGVAANTTAFRKAARDATAKN